MARPPLPYRRSVITDEISQDLDRAVALARRFDLAGLDIRSVWGKGIHELDDDELRRLRATADAAGMAVPSIAPPFLKCDIDSPDEWVAHKAILDRSLHAAEVLGSQYVRGFTFWRKGSLADNWGRIVDAYREVVPTIERSGLVVAIENEAACQIGTTERLPELLRDIGSRSVRALWDPANGAVDGEVAYPDAFERIIDDTVHIHLKDGRQVDGKWQHAIVGEGAVDLVAVSRALARRGYDGWVALETHYRPRQTDADLARPSGERFSEAGEEGTYACLVGWDRVLTAASAG